MSLLTADISAVVKLIIEEGFPKDGGTAAMPTSAISPPR
jgi:hypothetical protein